eukprot:6196317-Pleurochrysis_carterae.AAC.1
MSSALQMLTYSMRTVRHILFNMLQTELHPQSVVDGCFEGILIGGTNCHDAIRLLTTRHNG